MFRHFCLFLRITTDQSIFTAMWLSEGVVTLEMLLLHYVGCHLMTRQWRIALMSCVPERERTSYRGTRHVLSSLFYYCCIIFWHYITFAFSLGISLWPNYTFSDLFLFKYVIFHVIQVAQDDFLFPSVGSLFTAKTKWVSGGYFVSRLLLTVLLEMKHLIMLCSLERSKGTIVSVAVLSCDGCKFAV